MNSGKHTHTYVRDFTHKKMSKFLEDGRNPILSNSQEIEFPLILKYFSSQKPSWSSKIFGKQL